MAGLTRFQLKLASTILAAAEQTDLALAGGAALIVHGVTNRETRDLDLFSSDTPAVVLVDALSNACEVLKVELKHVQGSDTFQRHVVGGECVVDIANDHRLLPSVRTPVGATIALEELAADKVLALFSRAEARDFADVQLLAQRLGRDQVLDLAGQKDAGFDPAVFREMIGGIARFRDEDIPTNDAPGLRAWFTDWARELEG